jgi:hypothetical protein
VTTRRQTGTCYSNCGNTVLINRPRPTREDMLRFIAMRHMLPEQSRSGAANCIPDHPTQCYKPTD